MEVFVRICLLLYFSSVTVYSTQGTPNELVHCEGENVTLFCNVTGLKNITWVADDFFWECNDMTEVGNCALFLENITLNDSAIYNCTSENGTVYESYELVVSAPPDTSPSCFVNDTESSGNVYVIKNDSVTLKCEMLNSSSSMSLEWSNTNSEIVIISETIVLEGNDDTNGQEYTCKTIPCEEFSCMVGPVYVVTTDNFYINESSNPIVLTVGESVTVACVTTVPDTMIRLEYSNYTEADYSNNNTTAIVTITAEPLNDDGKSVVCDLLPKASESDIIASRETVINIVKLSTTLKATTERDATRIPTTQTSTTESLTTSKGQGDSGDLDAALIGIICGVIGGVLLIVVIIVIIVCCRNKETETVSGENGVVHRTKKKPKEGSKKHRSAILSWRHKLPLFSTPYDDTDDDESPNRTTLANNDADAIIVEYRPKSKIASQLRVDLDADDEGQGTIENGFVPFARDDQESVQASSGIAETRFGIMGPGTFAASSKSDKKDDKVDEKEKTENKKETGNEQEEETEDEPDPNIHEDYAKVSKSINPGASAFDNLLYGPIKGVDPDADSQGDEGGEKSDGGIENKGFVAEPQNGKVDDVQMDDNADLPPPPPEVLDAGDVQYDVPRRRATKDGPDRESEMYAEI